MADDKEFDVFDGDSGLKDDFDGVIVDCWFAVNPKAEGKTFGYLKIEADDGDEVEQRYSMGNDWMSPDGGETVEHPQDREDRPKRFNPQTAWFEFVKEAMASGAEGIIRERNEKFGGLGARYAEMFKGLKFHWEVKTEEFEIRQGPDKGKTVTSNRTLPTQFLGVEQIVKGEPGNEFGETGGGAAAETANGTGPLDGLDASDVAKIKVLAASHSYPDFVDQVLTQWSDNGNLIAALGDEKFYESMKG